MAKAKVESDGVKKYWLGLEPDQFDKFCQIFQVDKSTSESSDKKTLEVSKAGKDKLMLYLIHQIESGTTPIIAIPKAAKTEIKALRELFIAKGVNEIEVAKERARASMSLRDVIESVIGYKFTEGKFDIEVLKSTLEKLTPKVN